MWIRCAPRDLFPWGQQDKKGWLRKARLWMKSLFDPFNFNQTNARVVIFNAFFRFINYDEFY